MSESPRVPSTTVLEVAGLWARLPTGLGLRRKVLLEDISVRLEAGGVLGLLGPNGSGKTTLLRHMAGLLRGYRGDVFLLGQAALDPKALARVTYLPEDSPFPTELSGPHMLNLLASLRGQRGAKAKAAQAAALERAGLGETRSLPLGRYSRGMLRRFGLAQAFLFEPELVLLDEPTAGLDAPGLLLLEEWLREHRARGGSMVMSSHSLSDLVEYTTQLAILWQGRIAMQGPTQTLLAEPGRHWVQWQGAPDEEACRLYLAEQGAAHPEVGAVWRSVFDVYKDIQTGGTFGK